MKYHPHSMRFQVAISYSEESSIIANDLYLFLSEIGIICYNYKYLADKTKGVIETKIEEIYQFSDLNVMIWDESYAAKHEEEITSIEKQVLYDRHVKKNESDSLLIIVNNIKKEIVPSQRFNKMTYHLITNYGFFEIRNAIVERLHECYTAIDESSNMKIEHPHGEALNRGTMSFCKFIIDDNYFDDTRWEKLSDIKVVLTYSKLEFEKNMKVYLLPSGRVTTLLSHSNILKTQKMSLDIKRKLSKLFVEKNRGKELTGYLFFQNMNEMEYPHVYSTLYDNHLNEKLLHR